MLFCPWGFSRKVIGVGCHIPLQGIFPTQGSKQYLWASCIAGDSFTTEPPGKPQIIKLTEFCNLNMCSFFHQLCLKKPVWKLCERINISWSNMCFQIFNKITVQQKKVLPSRVSHRSLLDDILISPVLPKSSIHQNPSFPKNWSSFPEQLFPSI